MIRTYTPNDILTLPGAIEGLFNGYRGRVLYSDWEWVYVDRIGNRYALARTIPKSNRQILDTAEELHLLSLPLSFPEGAYRAACWIADTVDPPTPTSWWMLPGPSILPVWILRALLHASVLRVAAGQSPVRGVLDDWEFRVGAERRVRKAGVISGWHRVFGAFDIVQQWEAETGEGGELPFAEGKVLADDFALKGGVALLDGEALRIDVPDEKAPS